MIKFLNNTYFEGHIRVIQNFVWDIKYFNKFSLNICFQNTVYINHLRCLSNKSQNSIAFFDLLIQRNLNFFNILK